MPLDKSLKLKTNFHISQPKHYAVGTEKSLC